MPAAGPVSTPRFPELPTGFLALVATVLIADRLVFMLWASPLPDEAYYWLWGQNPALSYYDHPPLQAWIQAAVAAVFGDSLFALRLPALFSTAILAGSILWWLNGYAARQKILALLVVFASPLMFIFTAMVFNDHLMIALLALATVAVFKTLESVRDDGSFTPRHLYLAALLIGLAGLTKYNAALFALGVFATVLATARFRGMLRSVHLYLAILLTLLVLTPVFVWNMQNGAASFQYNLSDRMDEATGLAKTLWQMAAFLLSFGLAASPFLIAAFFRMLRYPGAVPQNWRRIAIATFFVSTALCLVLSAFTQVLYYWNLMALVAFLPFAGLYFRRWQVIAHLLLGMVVATLFTINYAVFPLSALVGETDYETAEVYGWPETAERAMALQQARPDAFLVASDYRNGSILGFWVPLHKVEVLSSRKSAFDFWRDETVLAGRDAIILTNEWHPLSPEITGRFAKVQRLETRTVQRFGAEVATYTFYLGTGYRPPDTDR